MDDRRYEEVNRTQKKMYTGTELQRPYRCVCNNKNKICSVRDYCGIFFS